MTHAEYRTRLADFEVQHGLVRPLMDRRVCSPAVHDLRAEWYSQLRDAGLSYPAIGRLVGRDHSTIVKVLQRHGRAQS